MWGKHCCFDRDHHVVQQRTRPTQSRRLEMLVVRLVELCQLSSCVAPNVASTCVEHRSVRGVVLLCRGFFCLCCVVLCCVVSFHCFSVLVLVVGCFFSEDC